MTRKDSSAPSVRSPNVSDRELLRVAGVVIRRLQRRPSLPIRHILNFSKEFVRVLRGRSALQPVAADRRFDDEGWTQGRITKGLMQIYLAAAQEAYALVTELELEGRDASSARFLAVTLIEALSPSNNPLINPAVRKAARESRGRSLLRGLQNLIGDQLDNDGLISMVDRAAFEVGRNVAATPGEVVFRNELLELLQYRPMTAEVYARPLLIVPPQINKFYVLDLSSNNSLVRYLVAQGFQVFMVSWRNPGPEHREWGMERYCDALEEAHAAVLEITGSPDVNWKGLCAGGLTSAVALARRETMGRPRSVQSLTLNVTLLDIADIRKTNLGYFITPEMLETGRAQSKKEGVLSGARMAKMFAWIRPNDLVWNYWVNNYLMGRKPAAFDVLYWNSDTTRLPAAMHSDFIDLAIANPFGCGRPAKVGAIDVDLKRVDVDKFIVAGRTDHITPWQGCYRSVEILGGRSEFVLVNSGHIQTLVSPPGKGKATYQIASSTPSAADEWLKSSSAVTGSWWEFWAPWLASRSGAKRPAPTALGSGRYGGLGAAPGMYVRQ